MYGTRPYLYGSYLNSRRYRCISEKKNSQKTTVNTKPANNANTCPKDIITSLFTDEKNNVKINKFKIIGIALASAVLAYSGRKAISAVGKGIGICGRATTEFLRKHTSGSVHETLGGVYHTFRGGCRLITSPFRAIASIFKKG